MTLVKVALVALIFSFALIACNGFALDEDTCKENDDCKGKLSLCKDSAICVDEVCKCRAPILWKDGKCTSPSDCPFRITPCDSRSPPQRVLHSGTTNFGNFPKGKPFTEILGNIPLSSSSCCLDTEQAASTSSMMFNIGSEMSIARFTSLLSLVWKVKRILNVRLEKAPKEGVKVVHELVMKIIKAKKDEITFNGRKGGIDLLVRLLEGGGASGHGGESYNYKYDNGGERHHISKHGEEEVLVVSKVYCAKERNEGLDYECFIEINCLSRVCVTRWDPHSERE
ncbi:hypothetical protein ACSQ67_025575 [Phaseolus vulgaris]